VTFTTRHGKTVSLNPVTFLHRFVQHVLPQGFHKVRHGGLYASTRTGGRLEQTRALLEKELDPIDVATQQTKTAKTRAMLTIEGYRCPHCDTLLVRTSVRMPRPRSPPRGAHA
jgi:hypothetical protein